MVSALQATREGYRYPRLIRYAALESNILATLDMEFNLLRIDKDKYDKLSEEDKQNTIKTHTSVTHCFLDREGKTRIVI
jgi:hypothetical protein